MAIRNLIGNALVGATTAGLGTAAYQALTRGEEDEEREYLIPSATREIKTPTATETATAAKTTSLSDSIGSILKTGSATASMATLVNPTTGDRQAVAVGSQDAQKLFGEGYILETAGESPEAKAAAAAEATASATAGATTSVSGEIVLPTTTTATGYDLGSLRANAQRLRQEAFSTVYGYSPDDWANLDPAAQRRLRNQRVQGIVGELGNVNAAIEMLKEEEKQARENAVDNLNLYLKYGLIGQLSGEELDAIAEQTGLSADALKTIGEQEEPPELKTVGGNLYSIQRNPETGQFDTQLIIQKSTGGGGGGGGAATSDFDEWYDEYVAPDPYSWFRGAGYGTGAEGEEEFLSDETTLKNVAYEYWRENIVSAEAFGEGSTGGLGTTNAAGVSLESAISI